MFWVNISGKLGKSSPYKNNKNINRKKKQVKIISNSKWQEVNCLNVCPCPYRQVNHFKKNKPSENNYKRREEAAFC